MSLCHAINVWATSPPTAAVWEFRDPITRATGTSALLDAAGFEVRTFHPRQMTEAFGADVIVLGSFVSEHVEYVRFMKQNAGALRDWVAGGGVLVQMVQSAATEPEPLFLPDGLTAHRDDIAWTLLRAPDDCRTPLLEGLLFDHSDGRRFVLLGRQQGLASWQTFDAHSGWAVHLWSDPQLPLREAALLEAEHGDGRFVLVAIPIDKLVLEDGSPAVEDPYPLAALTFAGNLRRYVAALQSGELPPVQPTVLTKAEPCPSTPGSWSMVALPDTQYATQDRPEVLEAQTRWIKAHRTVRDIRFVVHEGDVTHNGDRRQWRRARHAFEVLHGQIPYAVTTGNHDYERGSLLADRRTLFASYFPSAQARQQSTFVGVFSDERPENQAHHFSAGARQWLVVTLEYLPSPEVVEWVDGVLEDHLDHEVILVTHSYLDEIGEWIDLETDRDATEPRPPPQVYHDGEDLWNALVSQYASIRLVLCGHVTGDGAGRRVDLVEGRAVHQVLANFQMRRDAGEGWLRILEFLPDGRTIQVHTYSPWLDEFMTGPQQQFKLDLGPPAWPPRGP